MESQIDKDDVRTIIFMIVQRWAGGSLSTTEHQVVERFMEEEVNPLNRLELLQRMGTPGDILQWFMGYIRSRMIQVFCDLRPAAEDESVCVAS